MISINHEVVRMKRLGITRLNCLITIRSWYFVRIGFKSGYDNYKIRVNKLLYQSLNRIYE
jgi:hypothetical protein